MSGPMRVVSWNIQFGIESERAGEELADHAETRHADVYLLQEMDERGTAEIAERLGATYVYAAPAPHPQTGRDFGNSVITRWPVVDEGEIALPHQSPVNGQPRSATVAVVEVAGRQVACYSVHTEIPSLRLARRIEQWNTVSGHVRSAGFEHVVVGGDFNTVTTRGVRALTDTMAAADLRHVSAEADASYRRLGRPMTLDHLFGTGFDVAAAGVVATTAASDHLPLWVELTERLTP